MYSDWGIMGVQLFMLHGADFDLRPYRKSEGPDIVLRNPSLLKFCRASHRCVTSGGTIREFIGCAFLFFWGGGGKGGGGRFV